MEADGHILYEEQERRVLKFWHEAFSKLSMLDKFKLFIKGQTAIDPKQHREDFSGQWKSKDETLDAIGGGAEKVVRKVVENLPKNSKTKLEKIGQAIVEGCHKVNVAEKQNILQMLMGAIPDKTLQPATAISRTKNRKDEKRRAWHSKNWWSHKGARKKSKTFSLQHYGRRAKSYFGQCFR